jgi:hypothetical protein
MIFIPPTFIVSDQMDKKIQLYATFTPVQFMINQQIGVLLKHYMNLNYQLAPLIFDEKELKQFEKIRAFQDVISTITCDMHNIMIAQNNNIHLKTEAIRFEETTEKRISMLNYFLWSEVVMRCHRNSLKK